MQNVLTENFLALMGKAIKTKINVSTGAVRHVGAINIYKMPEEKEITL
jgi:hypothetical protein